MSYPVIEVDECIGCGVCIDACPCEVLDLESDVIAIKEADDCVGCGACVDACPTGAISEIAD